MIKRMGVHPGTRLEMITRHDDGTFRVWVALKSKQVPPEQYVGTYLELHPDGRIVQWNDDDAMEVMEPCHKDCNTKEKS